MPESKNQALEGSAKPSFAGSIPAVASIVPKLRIVDRGGGALIGLLFVVVIGFVIWKFAPVWTSKNPPDDQQPASIAVEGPTRIRPGGTYTYFVTLTYPRPLHPPSSYWVVAQVLENGVADPLLDSKVRIAMRAGSSTGRGSFALSCVAEGDSFVLQGDDGSSTADGAWQISARLQDQADSAIHRGGSTLNVICGDR